MSKPKYNNMSQIRNIFTLEQLCEFDSIIRQTCKRVINPNDYDDIVNDMYIKLARLLPIRLKKGKPINGGYVFVALKSINTNMLKKRQDERKRFNFEDDDVSNYNVLDESPENSEDYYIEIDKRIDKLDELLSNCLNDDEIVLFKFYKMNSLDVTSIFYGEEQKEIKLQIKKIRRKIAESGGFSSIN